MRRSLLGLLLAALTLLAVPAAADTTPPTPKSVGDLLRAFNIEGAPADYVVVVDTSSSMMDKPALYPPVVAAYKRFVSAIGDHDQLSVITFDSTPNLRFAGNLDNAGRRSQANNALPAEARGQATDIGAALGAVLDRLERPDSNEVQTVIFLTDGQINAPGSPYANPNSSAWHHLAQRASQVGNGHRLSVYGAGLGGKSTGVGVLKTVFPDTQIVSLPAEQLSSFFNEAIQRARVERLYTPVTTELKQGFVSTNVTAGKLGNPTTLTVTLKSKLPHLGATVILDGVKVTTADGQSLQSTLVGGPRTLQIGPRGSSEPFKVSVSLALPNGRKIGTETQERQFKVDVQAHVSAEPSDVIGQSLGVKTDVRFVQADPVAATRTVGTPLWYFLVALIVLALLLLLLLWLYRRFLRTPPLPGGVLMEDASFKPFRGAKTELPNRNVEIPNTDGAVVEFFTKRGKFRKRVPRVYVRKLEGSSRVSSYGVERPLHTEEQVMATDMVVVGRARLRVAPKGK